MRDGVGPTGGQDVDLRAGALQDAERVGRHGPGGDARQVCGGPGAAIDQLALQVVELSCGAHHKPCEFVFGAATWVESPKCVWMRVEGLGHKPLSVGDL
ncbi:hypothetical protein [Streptomyces sp. NPDC026589]|uniref:hypothetical protein n=1 Tax=Streptomyces TaxID=1883 RepID=UPI0033EB8176|nr:hypothetical protein OHB50_30965 [Streptomyces anulatus]